MAVSSDIFELIKGMNRKERSYFRRYFKLSSAGRNGVMIKLFERLVFYSGKFGDYDEEKLKGTLTPSEVKHLPVVKNNLYKLILRSLLEYRNDQSNDAMIKRLIEQYDLLFSRSLLKQSETVLKKAKRIAEENELFQHIHTILNKERVLARYMLNADEYENVIKRVYIEQMICLERIKNLSEMNDLGSRITLMLQKYPTSKSRDENLSKEINEVLDNPLLRDEQKMLSGTALKRFYNINIVLSEWRKDYNAALIYAKKYADEVEKDADKNKSTVHDYIISIHSLITESTRTNDIDEYESAYSKLSNVKTRFPSATERDMLEAFYYLGLSVFTASGENYHPERGENMLAEAEANSKQLEQTLSTQQKIVWYFLIARMFFGQNSFNGAGKWLNRLIAIPNIDLSQDYQCYGRIMNLVVAYESGNPDSIEHELRRTYYFLTKRNKVYKYEKIILEYLRQSFRIKTERGISEMLVFMNRDLKAISTDPFEENAFDAFNIIKWLEWKIGE
ncbi:MAG: hypothetical protein ABI543_07945 [Ignavibacteria bacterium]